MDDNEGLLLLTNKDNIVFDSNAELSVEDMPHFLKTVQSACTTAADLMRIHYELLRECGITHRFTLQSKLLKAIKTATGQDIAAELRQFKKE